MTDTRNRLVLVAIGAVASAAAVTAPLVGWPPVARLPALLVPAIAIALLVVRPQQGWLSTSREWEPSPHVVRVAALIIGLVLFWFIWTRFRSGEINAVDFTVYFDRPSFQTLHGRPLFVETANVPGFSHRSELAVHAYWAMVPIGLLYALGASPLWLLALSVVAVVAGAIHVLRIMERLGVGGLLASVTALAFVLNDNTARTLNYGFHPEVLYAWFIPWLIDAGLRGRRASFVAATLACVLVKEDACLPLFAASVALGLHRFGEMTWPDRALFLVMPTGAALINLGVYYEAVVPALNGSGAPTYAAFWANYGPTPIWAAVGMLAHPRQVLIQTVTSGIRTVIWPHLFLPLIGWRWTVGVLPIVAIYAASANDQLRAFGIYYSIVLVPFLILGASSGALTIARRITPDIGRARLAASVAILLGALLVGSTRAGYSLRPWRTEITAAPNALAALAAERVVLVQSGVYVSAGYEERVRLLTPETLNDSGNAGAAVLLAPALSAYPFALHDLDELARRPSIRPMPRGILTIRIPDSKRP
jgi:uncharacterized membrane protein